MSTAIEVTPKPARKSNFVESTMKNVAGVLVEVAAFGAGSKGSLAKEFRGEDKGTAIDVVNGFPWTLSPVAAREEVPYITLIEFACNESQINRQVAFYAAMAEGTSETGSVLDVYKQIFSHDVPTNFRYKLPYFSDSAFDLSTPNWNKIEGAGQQIKDLISGGTEFFLGKDAGSFMKKGMEFATAAGTLALQQQYPVVGILDRPRIFASHDERQITVSFPLYNTENNGDWSKNYGMLYQLMSQNLFNKNDYITGVAPVFYSVHIPGQYYCWASAMTNISVKNLGNVRMIDGKVVPDAYQVTLTLSEMVMPSKNQFEAVATGEASQLVTTSTIAEAKSAAEAAVKAVTTPTGTTIQGTQKATGEGQRGQGQASPYMA